MATDDRSARQDRLQDVAIRALLAVVMSVPYRVRVPLMGWLTARIIAPLAGWRQRIRENLAHVLPDLPGAEVARLVRDVPDNVGRSLIEIYSGAEFKSRVGKTRMQGAGVRPLARARAEGRPVVLVTAHFGNFDALRAALSHRGYAVAGLYREMNNPYFNAHYVAALESIGTPIFPTDREGIVRFRRHLNDGGIVGILTDLYSARGANVTFFGQPAPTSVAACAWAARANALVIPCFGRRRDDGISFDAIFETPVPLGDPRKMTQEITDRLEARVRADMEQWFWIHRRWKPERQRRRRKWKHQRRARMAGR